MIRCIVNMSVALITQKRLKSRYFYELISFYFLGIIRKKFPVASSQFTPGLWTGCNPLAYWQRLPHAQPYTRVLITILSVHLSNVSIKKPYFDHCLNLTLDAFYSQLPDEEVLGWYSPILIFSPFPKILNISPFKGC